MPAKGTRLTRQAAQILLEIVKVSMGKKRRFMKKGDIILRTKLSREVGSAAIQLLVDEEFIERPERSRRYQLKEGETTLQDSRPARMLLIAIHLSNKARQFRLSEFKSQVKKDLRYSDENIDRFMKELLAGYYIDQIAGDEFQVAEYTWNQEEEYIRLLAEAGVIKR